MRRRLILHYFTFLPQVRMITGAENLNLNSQKPSQDILHSVLVLLSKTFSNNKNRQKGTFPILNSFLIFYEENVLTKIMKTFFSWNEEKFRGRRVTPTRLLPNHTRCSERFGRGCMLSRGIILCLNGEQNLDYIFGASYLVLISHWRLVAFLCW